MDNYSFIVYFIQANIVAAIIGYIMDMFIGDPEWHFHPVRLMGSLILSLEKIFYRLSNKLIGGLLLLATSILIIIIPTVLILSYAYSLSYILYILLNSLIVWVGLSVKDMSVQVGKVQKEMKLNDIVQTRYALSLLVSRDTAKMESDKISSSLIETISENFTDAAVAPLFYSLLLGGIGVLIFKIISTLDSMIGYDNERYKRFGTFAAKLDDLLNFIPARLSIIPVVIVSILHHLNTKKALTTFFNQRLDHKSPNSAHSISAFAGALDVKLGGATSYGGLIIHKPVINPNGKPSGDKEIQSALLIYKDGAFIFLLISIIILLIMLALCTH